MMFSFSRLLLGVLLLSAVPLHAQTRPDTSLVIQEVIVRAARRDRGEQLSLRTTRIQTEVLKHAQTQSLSEVLSENSVVNVKTMGQGALSTASFRGASSSHTQVTWNGVPIKSPMIGSFDFSQVPVFFTDGVTLRHGSGSFGSGSGGLGGSVDFSNNPSDSTRLSVLSEYGSNQTLTEGLALRNRWGRWSTVTRLYYQQSDNDYRYLNKVFSKDPFYERRKNAEYKHAGAMQELYWRPSFGQELSLLGWWQWNDRNLPPPTMVNHPSREQQVTRDLRLLARYRLSRERWEWKISTAMLHGTIDYSRRFDIGLGDLFTHSRSRSWIATSNYSLQVNPQWRIGGDLTYRLEQVVSSSLTESHQRNTLSAQLFSHYRLSHYLLLEGRGMVETIGQKPALTYSVGGTWRLPQEWLLVKVSNAYNHRFPTMTDLYWNPGGNPDLLPEKGFSSDLTFTLAPSSDPVRIKADVTGYYNRIKNWIMWVPKGNGYFWEPANFSEVHSTGVEVSAEAQVAWGRTSHRLRGNYAFTHSVDRSERKDGTYGKQLPYIPRNKWNAAYLFEWRGVEANYTLSFTDIRFTSADQSYYTNAYMVHNIYIGYQIPLSKSRLKATLRVNNLLNAYYESTQYYPMPLRNFNFGLHWSF